MTIRDLAPADLERVLEINQANVPEVGSVDLDRMRFIVAESALALVVTDADAGPDAGAGPAVGPDTGAGVVGFCLVLAPGSAYDSLNYTWFMERYSTAYYLDRVAFDHRAQGRGLGSELYTEVDRRIAELGVALTLEVNIDPPNEPSLAFHRKFGFTEVGRKMSSGVEVSMMHKGPQ